MSSTVAQLALTIIVEKLGDQDDEFSHVTLDSTTDIATLKIVIAAQCNIEVKNQALFHKNTKLSDDTKTLSQIGVTNEDAIVVRSPNNSSSQQPNSGGFGMPMFGANTGVQQMPAWLNTSPVALQQQIRSDSSLLTQLLHQNPELAQAALAETPNAMTTYMNKQRTAYMQKVMMENQRIQMLNDDPLNPDAQRAIHKEIEQSNVNENYETAINYMPEAFARVVMLYIPMEVEGFRVNAFVDSGAQTTIMSQQLAEKCGIMRLVDRRFAGIAKGVGTAKIIGRVHMAKLKFGKTFLPCSFTIMEDPDMEFLFGLDMLRRHHGIIDLSKQVLRIGEDEVQFLQEKDIPHLRQQNLQDVEMSGNNLASAASSSSTAAQSGPSATSTSSTSATGPSATATSATASSGGNLDASRLISQILGGGGAQPQQANRGLPRGVKEEDVTRLINSMACTRQQAIQALASTGGNAEMAAALLFETMGGGLGF